MAGITPNEGQDYVAEVLYPQSTAVAAYSLGLFTNLPNVLTETSVWAHVTEPTGTGYLEISLVAGNFVVSAGGVTTYPQQSWTAVADWNLPVYGYYIRTQEGTPRLLHFEYNAQGARTMSTGNVYTVDLSTDTEST